MCLSMVAKVEHMAPAPTQAQSSCAVHSVAPETWPNCPDACSTKFNVVGDPHEQLNRCSRDCSPITLARVHSWTKQ